MEAVSFQLQSKEYFILKNKIKIRGETSENLTPQEGQQCLVLLREDSETW